MPKPADGFQWKAIIRKMLFGVSILSVSYVPAEATGSDVAELLAQCQKSEAPTRARLAACSEIVTRPKVDSEIRGEALLVRGYLKEQSGNHEDAVGDYSTAISLDGENETAYFNRGNALEALGRYEEAIRDYTAAVRINPKLAEAFNNRGRAYDALGSFKLAIESYTAALALEPKSAATHYNRGLAWFELAEYPKAIGDFDRAQALGLRDSDLWATRATAHERTGNNAKALLDYEAAVKSDAGNRKAAEGLARLKGTR